MSLGLTKGTSTHWLDARLFNMESSLPRTSIFYDKRFRI